MKKIITILLAICMVVTGLPYVAYAAGSTPEISFEEFSQDVSKIEDEYDDNELIFNNIKVENGSEFYYIDGESELMIDATGEVFNPVVTKDDITIPFSVVQFYCDTYTDKDFLNLNDLENLGFEVVINDNIAIITKPIQTNRIIVKSKYAIPELDSVAIAEGYDNLHIIQFDDAESTEDALEYYNKLRYVEYAEPDIIMTTQEIDYDVDAQSGSSDMFYDNHLSWGSEYIGVDDYIDYLGDVDALPEIVVGIVDTGIDLDHTFLKDRIIETGVNYSNTGKSDSEDDDHGHGSHVAGIIVDNTTSNVKISGYKALNAKGSGTSSDICLAIYKAMEDNVNVINMSIGGKGSDRYYTDTVTAAINQGITVCVAAGNNGDNAANYSPASIKGCITVAAMDYKEQIPYWSNWGDCVDIIAPGVHIDSAYMNNRYETLSGTSMACPFVSAASALILSKYPTYHSKEILEVLQSNARDCSPPEELKGRKALYIGTVTEYNKDRTAIPEISLESGYYEESIAVELTCSEENAEIYYTTDGTRASQANGILYTEPIIVDKVTSLHAVAYAPNKLKSLQNSAQYYLRYLDDEGNFEIDSEGTITAYNGDNNFLIVPETVNGITVTGIGTKVFYKSDIEMIEFPDTLTHIDENSFYWCKKLKSMKGKNLVHIGRYALARCNLLKDFDVSNLEVVERSGCYGIGISEINNTKLTEIATEAFNNCKNVVNINLPNVIFISNGGLQFNVHATEINIPNVELIGTSGLYDCSSVVHLHLPHLTELGEAVFMLMSNLKSIEMPQFNGKLPRYTFSYSGINYYDNDNITAIQDYAFQDSEIETVILRNAKTVGELSFGECSNLKNLYLPVVENIGTRAFRNVNKAQLLFLPSLVSTKDLPVVNADTTIYLSEKFTSYEITWYNHQNCTIVAPKDSYAEELTNTGFQNKSYDNNFVFIPSDSMATEYGGQIRLSDNGLRFGFSWTEIDELNQYAKNKYYGFEYGYCIDDQEVAETLNKTKEATNRLYFKKYNGTTFNLVFTDIPQNTLDTKITVRAHVCIDGMDFYSEELTRSYSQVASGILGDDKMPQYIKEQIQQKLNEEA